LVGGQEEHPVCVAQTALGTWQLNF